MTDSAVLFKFGVAVIALSVLALMEAYVQICQYLKKQSWTDLLVKYWGKRKVTYGKHYRFRDIVESLKTGRKKASTAVEQRFESTYFKVTFGILYPFLLIKVLCFRFPLYLGRMVWSKLVYGRYASHSEEDVVDCLLMCPSLYIMCKAVDKEKVLSIYRSYNNNEIEAVEGSIEYDNHLLRTYLSEAMTTELEEDQAWIFELPKNLPGDAYSGDLKIRHATIIFLQHRRRILFASHLGVPLDLTATTARSTTDRKSVV